MYKYSCEVGSEMIGLNWLKEICNYAVASTHIAKERPVSIGIVADVGTGKTDLLAQYINRKDCLYITSFTRFGLINDHLPKLRSGIVKTIIIPDMVQLIAGINPSMHDGVSTFLNSLMEEGLKAISTYNITFDLEAPVRANVLTAFPRRIFEDKRCFNKWNDIGFLSRMLLVTYSYDKETTARIMKFIQLREYTLDAEKPLVLPQGNVDIELSEKMAEQLTPLVTEIQNATQIYGFRYQHQLQTLTMARALIQGRKEVIQEDVDRIKQLASWINLDFKPVNPTE